MQMNQVNCLKPEMSSVPLYMPTAPARNYKHILILTERDVNCLVLQVCQYLNPLKTNEMKDNALSTVCY